MNTTRISPKVLFPRNALLFLTLIFNYTLQAQCYDCPINLEKEVSIKNHFRGIGSDIVGVLNNYTYEEKYLNDPAIEGSFNLRSVATIVAAGLDSDANLYVAQNQYAEFDNKDFIPGPLRVDINESIETSSIYLRIWKVTSDQIKDHKEKVLFGVQFIDEIPNDILEWPAKGNPYLGAYAPTEDMAPFYDSNEDGIYNPIDGDYPIALIENPDFIPSEFTFSIYNDYCYHSNTFGVPIKLEIHQINYVVKSFESNLANHSIFTRLKYIYKGTKELVEFKLGILQDDNLGISENDRLGIDTICNSTYTYNKNGIDYDGSKGNIGIPNQLGAIKGILHLTHDIKSFICFSTLSNNTGSSRYPEEIYNTLSSKWKDGTPLTVGGTGYNPGSTNYTDFVFPDLPTDDDGWSIQNDTIWDNYNNDLNSSSTLVDSTLSPCDSGTIDYIDYLIYDGETKGFDIFDQYPAAMAELKNYYNKLLTNQISSIDNQLNDDIDFKLYPNPVKDRLHIQFPNRIEGRIDVLDTQGKLVITKSISDLQAYSLSTSSLLAGYYLLRLSTSDGSVVTQPFVK